MGKLALSLVLALAIAAPAMAYKVRSIVYVYEEHIGGPKRYALVEDWQGNFHRVSWKKANKLEVQADVCLPCEGQPSKLQPMVSFPSVPGLDI